MLLDISHFLSSDEDLYARKLTSVYQLLKTFRDYNEEAFLQVTNSKTKLSKYSFLALYAKDHNNDPSILSKISEKLNSSVLNDKEKLNYYNIRYFQPYLNIIDY